MTRRSQLCKNMAGAFQEGDELVQREPGSACLVGREKGRKRKEHEGKRERRKRRYLSWK